MARKQVRKHMCELCRRYPSKMRFVNSEYNARVCGYCQRKLIAAARMDLRVLEEEVLQITPDAWSKQNALDS